MKAGKKKERKKVENVIHFKESKKITRQAHSSLIK